MQLTREAFDNLSEGHTQMIRERMLSGGHATLLTFMFNHVRGSELNVAQQMREAVETTYSTILKHCFRKPQNVPILKMPLWICTPDYPIHKDGKYHFRDIVINEGRHIHVIAVMPPDTKMKQSLDEHFEENQKYAGEDRLLMRIHSRKISDELAFVTSDGNKTNKARRPRKEEIRDELQYLVGYARKGIKTPRVGTDGWFVLPRTHSEMEPHRADKAEQSC
ncbi:hypothetical protein NKI34_27305 [Mesorhizobium sp. M0700]|uniref:hypothetical protein n=1 Tax=Mesorhizobium sp. M0700 TaxID=2956988 RepID=UPI003339B92C